MPASRPSPRIALQRWLGQLHYNNIRNVETLHHAIRSDEKRPLRGLIVANDLCLTRKRVFYRVDGEIAKPLSIEEVAANYNLDEIKETYRKAIESWKSSHRKRATA